MKKIKNLVSLFAIVLILAPTLKVDAVAYIPETTPHVTLSSYSIAEGTLAQGEEVTLNLDFTNLSKKTDVDEILVTYTSPNNSAYPLFGSSNQFYINDISSEQTEEVQLTVTLAETATTDVQLAFSLEYVSSTGEQYNNLSYIAIPMKMDAELTVNSLYVASSANVGINSLVSINYGNQSEDDLSNVTMILEGDIPEEQKKVVLGDLAAGEVNSLDYYVSFLDAGTQTLTISCTYEDKNGNILTLNSKDFTVQVLDANTAVTPDNTNTATEAATTTEGISVSTVLLVIVSAVIVILIAAVILRTVRRNRKS